MQLLRPLVWNAEKNELLKSHRGVCFEDVVLAVEAGDVLQIEPNPNQSKYRGQLRMVVRIGEYVYIVPFVIDQERGHIFLKTIIPSRKHTKSLLSDLSSHL